MDNFHYERKLSHATTKSTLVAVSKINKTQRRGLVHTVQLNYNFTIPCVNLHGSPQYHGWFLLTGIRVPRLLTVHEHGTMKLRM